MSSIHKNLNYLNNQRGWVLVVGLVILVMLTILSMAMMKTARLEEKMAGATRHVNLSFQAAEIALLAAESVIESKTNASYFDTSADEPEDPFADDYWNNAEEIDGELEGVASPPLYVIKKLQRIDDEDNTAPTVFRVTVRGTGGTNNRVTLLRSHYAKVFSDENGSVTRALFAALGLQNVAKSTVLKSAKSAKSAKSGSCGSKAKSSKAKSSKAKSSKAKSSKAKSGGSKAKSGCSTGANSARPVGRLSWEQLFPSQ